MNNKGVFTRILAIVGTVLVWLPVLAPIALMTGALIRMGIFHFDYLMPAELFPVALVGGGLLLWAAVRAKTKRGLIGGWLGAAVLLLVISQVVAVVSGMASGEVEPTELMMGLVMGMIVGYVVCVVVLGVGGILLTREISKRREPGYRIQD
jgi:hypothetical protein